MSDIDLPTRTKRGLDIGTAAELADLFHELSHNKETRKAIAAVVRKAKPDSPHAAAFADVDIEDKLQAFRDEQDAKELERQKTEIISRMNEQRSRLLSGGDDGSGRKYSEDDVKNIEALMQKKGIPDYEDGAVLYAATQPPVTRPEDRPPQHGATWEFPEWAKFGKDPVRASRDIASEVIAEFQRKRR